MARTAQSNRNNDNNPRLEYKKVQFNVNEIAPDAPAGEWGVAIPRGHSKVQPTKEDRYPMLIIPIQLLSSDEADDSEMHKKALGTTLSAMIVFFGDEKARAARMSKIRLRQLCEAADVDLDFVPNEIGDDPEKELAPLIRELEGKKFTAWTRLVTRKDTGETVTELSFVNPNQALSKVRGDDDDEDEDNESAHDEDDDDDRPRGRKKAPAKKKPSANRSNGRA